MDSLLSIITDPIKQLITECVVAPLKRHICYPFTYKTNFQELSNQVEKLRTKRDNLLPSVNQAQRRGDEIMPAVQKWLIDANEAIAKAEIVIREQDQARQNCCNCQIPNLKKQYQLSRKAEGEASIVEKLQNDAKFDEVSFRPNLKPVVALSVYGDEVLGSRSSILEQVMGALADPHINVVGLHGMPGVGKTTLAEYVKKRATEAQAFGHVFMTIVSPTPDTDRIRQQLADTLGLKFQEETPEGKANRLHQALMNTERILLIMDDIWEELPLQKIGIPSGNYHKGCQLLLTSRSLDVLSRMDSQRCFRLDVLSENESWSLFSSMVGELESVEVRSIAAQVAQKCAGLPLAIVAVAKALKGKESYEWRNALTKLSLVDAKRSPVKVVYSAIDLSYTQLPDDEVRSFFLLCGQLGHSHISVEDLLKYSIGLDLLKGLDTMEDRRDNILTWISYLEASSLLLNINLEGFVKIHDLVRDAALSIASSRQHHVLSMKSDGFSLKEWPKKDALQKCSRVCLPYCDFEELPDMFESQDIEFVMLGFDYHSLRIPDSFFQGIGKLKVLHFSKIRFSSLPKSLGSLASICTLYFSQCELQDVSIIGELRNLEILSFARSMIRHLPKEIGQLSQLKLLDLSNCKNLKFIPAGVLSNLSKLEELYMLHSFDDWEKVDNANLDELEGLSHLTTLEFYIPNPMKLPKSLFYKDLTRYKIFIERRADEMVEYNPNFSRILVLPCRESISKDPSIKMLMKKSEFLYLYAVDRTSDLFFDGGGEIFPQLKQLRLEDSSLEKICHGGITTGSFSNLKILSISFCYELENLFSHSVVRGISKLEILAVEWCGRLENIVVDENDANGEVVTFSHLRELRLVGLHQFKSFWGGAKMLTNARSEEIGSEVEVDTSLSIFNKMFAFPALEKLYIRLADKTKRIWQSQIAADSFGKLKFINIRNCKELETVFSFDVMGRFLMLEELSLFDCSSLQHICQLQEEITLEETQIFPSLKILNLEMLPRLSNLYPRNGNFQWPSLKKLHILDCPKVKTEHGREKIVKALNHKIFPNLEELSLDKKNVKIILQSQLPKEFLCQLKILALSYLPSTLGVTLSGILRRLPNLEKLQLANFSFKEEQFQYEEPGIVPLGRIRELNLESISNLKHIWKQDFQLYPFLEYLEIMSVNECLSLINLAQPSSSFQYLTTLDVYGCHNMINLVTSSVAKSMVQLAKMTVSYCDKLVEVVANEQGGNPEEIVFDKLKILELVKLENLASFRSSSCTFKFPSLEQVIVERCPNMKVFSEGDVGTPKLRRVLLSTEYLDDWRWKGNLNDTIQHMFIEMVGIPSYYRDLRISELPRRQFPVETLDATSLEVFNCGAFSYAIPFYVVPRLGNLKVLTITKSDSIEEVIGLEDQNVDGGPAASLMSNLHELRLIDLPRLRHVWNPDPPGVLIFKNLKHLKIHNCSSFTTVFKLSVAQSLERLKSIEVKGCILLEQIITDEGVEAERNNTILPSLLSTSLENLPELKSFYSGCGFICCPKLIKIDAVRCPKLKLFSSAFSCMLTEEQNDKLLKGDFDVPVNGQVAIPSLEELTVDWQTLRDMWHENVGAEFFCRLKAITLTNFLSECPLLPSDFLVKFNNLEKIAWIDSLEEMFSPKVDVNEEKYMKSLKLSKLQNLKHLAAEDSQIRQAFESLVALEVSECNRLEILVPSSISFQNLSTLEVSGCCGLINLMTCLAAASLGKLTRMRVVDCEMLEEIVASERDGVLEIEIVFKQLKYLKLVGLPRLTCFCSSNYAFHFPSLEDVRIRNCPKMLRFAQGELSTPNLLGIKTTRFSHAVRLGSLNSTIHEMFMEMYDESDIEES